MPAPQRSSATTLEDGQRPGAGGVGPAGVVPPGRRRPIYIKPRSPWQTPWVESFNGRVRDELLNVEEFGSLTEAQVVTEAWRMEYNTYRPHSALGGLTPAEYAARWTNQHQQSLS